jgi:hypothetical protein
MCILLSLLGEGSVKGISLSIARQRLGKLVPALKNTSHNRIVGRVIFYSVRVLTKESLWVSLCISLSLLGNNTMKIFPLQRIVGGVIFYSVRVISKKSRRLLVVMRNKMEKIIVVT